MRGLGCVEQSSCLGLGALYSVFFYVPHIHFLQNFCFGELIVNEVRLSDFICYGIVKTT